MVRFYKPKNWRKAAGYTGLYNAGKLATRLALNRYRSYTQQKRKNSTRSGQGVTFQNDRRLIYKKKAMPYKKKKRWLRQVRTVNAVNERELGTQTVVFNTSIVTQNNNSTLHGTETLALYSVTSNNTWLNDLTYLHEMDNVTDPTAVLGTTVDDTTKYMFQSGIMDITMRNTSRFADGGADLNGNCTLEVDVYEMTIKRKTITGTTQLRDINEIFNDGSGDTKDIAPGTLAVGATSINIDERGCTPWDIPQALGKFGVKIYKKTKLFISNGQTSTYQVRDPKRHVFSRGRMADTPGVNMPGATRFIYIVFKAVPGIEVGLLPGETIEEMTFGVTRKYMYKIEGRNASRDLKVFA